MIANFSELEMPESLPSRGDIKLSTPVGAMNTRSAAWLGSAFLFVKSTSEKIDLSYHYNNSKQKPHLLKAFKMALTAGSEAGDMNAIGILKVYCGDPQLIIYLRFCGQEVCRRFLQRYREGSMQEELQNQLQVALSLIEVPIQMELKVGTEKLDAILDDEERCLQYINKEKPDRLPDEEIADLEESLRTLNCQQKSTESSENEKHLLPSQPKRSLSVENSEHRVTFLFQKQVFVDRPLTSEDQQKFSRMVGRNWKQVARCLQKTCPALREPVIESLSYELEREGLYEQAYQMLLRFIQSEGKKATLQRVVAALQETGLTSLAEELLGI